MLARNTEFFNSRGNAAATIALLLAAQPISPSQFAKAENDEPACRLSRVRPSVIDQPLSLALCLFWIMPPPAALVTARPRVLYHRRR